MGSESFARNSHLEASEEGKAKGKGVSSGGLYKERKQMLPTWCVLGPSISYLAQVQTTGKHPLLSGCQMTLRIYARWQAAETAVCPQLFSTSSHVWIFKFRLKITSYPQCPTRALKRSEKSIVAKEFHLKREMGERKDRNGHVMLRP